jgi:sulfur carrier protein
MKLKVNGEEHEVPQGVSVTGLLCHLQLSAPRLAVEVNRTLVPRSRHAEHLLADGDQVEIVTFVGGG